MAPQRLHIARDGNGRYRGFVYCPQCMEETDISSEELIQQETADWSD
jgi:hypothetical protein